MKQFKAESKRLLDLMINSIYTHKEIFLREIISNASDAIDKLLFKGLTDDKVAIKKSEACITVSLDKSARTITVSDNGIGMDEKDLENNLGVIAQSGTGKFKEELEEGETKKKGGKNNPEELIGQFGVGFYSAFMVADKITVITRKYGEEQAYKWESSGVEGYTITPCEKENVGTDVIMHIKEDGEESGEFTQYLSEWKVKELITKYSDYIRFPIKMAMPHSELKEGCPEDKPEYEDVYKVETLNSQVPIWQRQKSSVKPEEYDEFYNRTFMDFEKPQRTITVSAEGNVSFKALLFIPGKMPYNYFSEEYKPGLQLYSAGVMIMDKCTDLIPDYFNFVRGVVDSPDLSLNISRELLQHDRQLKMIREKLEKKIKAELMSMLEKNREDYETFFHNFGKQLKVCTIANYGMDKEKLQDLLMFYSAKEKKLITLNEYVENMKPEQKHIYYASGESITAIDSMPQIDVIKDHDMDILYFTDKVDEFIVDALRTYKDKDLRSALDADPDLEDEKKDDTAEAVYDDSFKFMKDALGERVAEIKASKRLKDHPVCLTCGEGISFEMEKYFAAVQPEMNMKAKRILEINTEHPAFKAFDAARITDPEKAKKYAEVLYNQALLIAGFTLDNPTEYTDLVTSLFN
ncbi:MAG: molecular chaperone HtpG [Eubacteriales bacterium]|nr:molecular chaperone HtpG [Eubacteriales bacterium]